MLSPPLALLPLPLLNAKQIHINLSLIFTKQFLIKFAKFFIFINTYEFYV
jgi:hypothetical protein